MTKEQFAKKHEGRFRLDILNVALAAKVGSDGDLRETTEMLLRDILAFGREIAAEIERLRAVIAKSCDETRHEDFPCRLPARKGR